MAGPALRRAQPSGPGTALLAAVRGALLRCADDFSSVQDQLDCAQLLCAAGFAEEALVLCRLAFVQLGFSPARVGEQPGMAAWVGIAWEPGWTDDAGAEDGAPSPALPVWSLGAAVGQLRHLVASAGGLPALPARGSEVADAYARGIGAPPAKGPGPARPIPDATAGGIPEGIAETCGRLFGFLLRPGAAGMGVGTGEAGLLERLRDAVLARPAYEARNHVGAGIAALCEGVASDGLRHFLGANADLAYGPFGSAGLLHAAARLDVSGLGPYFTRAANLLRDGRDLLGLVRLAGATEPDDVERWSFLLSQHVPEELLHDLVQELADLGMLRAVWGIFVRALRQGAAPLPVLQAVRDAGLDNGDLGLALRAQRSLTHWHPERGVDWVVLADVEATAGNVPEAERALRTCLALDPAYPGAGQRLVALREGRYGPYLAKGGFSTPNSRKLVRLRRRQAEGRAG